MSHFMATWRVFCFIRTKKVEENITTMSSADEKHQKRLVRMLSKYGEVKKPVVERRPKAAEVDGKHVRVIKQCFYAFN